MFKSFKTVVLLASLSGLILLIGSAFSRNGLTIALIVAVAMNIGSYWFSDKLAIRMARAREVSEADAPWYYEMVRGLSERANAPMPRLYISPSPQPNAFATGRNPRNAAVCLNEGLLELLDKNEMEAVLAHELSHVYNRDILIGTIAATLATAITFVARFAFFFGGGGGGDRDNNNPIAQLALVFLAPIAALLIQFAVTRSRETTADTSGAQLSGQPLALASALEKLDAGGRAGRRLPSTEAERSPAFSQLYISAPFGGTMTRGMSSLFRTHPTTESRVANLRAIARRMGQIA